MQNLNLFCVMNFLMGRCLSVTFRFLLNRLERLVGKPAKGISEITRFLKLEDKAIYINPGDIMFVIARKR